ncbi:helix-turn-helix transcriptional regulator [Lacticaseibacillus chiayiensis]|uniref:helix-turn-helix transcriptional regulator n=1 Tax=Lacticaseibacillus chiayiensis TaxID=2100821 RepID=UPI0010113393|nr:helix-turn-helix transcriptional regulator [Lacticaseibacillus chiayiensis]RXT55645.1 transcriptional regulator [Lacticaseibacillus chiayiensis]
MNFSKQLQQIRTAHRMTQAELAQQLNVSRHTVSNWENGRNLPDLEMVTLIARIFDVSLDHLILDNPQLKKKLIKDSTVNRWQTVMAVLTTIFAIMIGMSATTLFGFYPQWLSQVIWWLFVGITLVWAHFITPKSVDIFADWSVLSRRLTALSFSILGLIFLIAGLAIVWYRGISPDIILTIVGGLFMVILTKPIWPQHQHAK